MPKLRLVCLHFVGFFSLIYTYISNITPAYGLEKLGIVLDTNFVIYDTSMAYFLFIDRYYIFLYVGNCKGSTVCKKKKKKLFKLIFKMFILYLIYSLCVQCYACTF